MERSTRAQQDDRVRQVRGGTRSGEPVRAPALEAHLLDLQRRAGNTAVAAILSEQPVSRQAARGRTGRAVASVESPTAPPPETTLPAFDSSLVAAAAPRPAVMGYIRSRDSGGQGTLGLTITPNFTEHTVPGVRFITRRRPDGRWEARPTRAWLPAQPHIEAFYPRPGPHSVGTGAAATHFTLSDAASAVVAEGEREHVGDWLYAWSIVAGIVDRALSAVMALQPVTASTEQAAQDGALQLFRSAVPPKLRWPISTRVSMGLIQAVTRLGSVTWSRDRPQTPPPSAGATPPPGAPRGAVWHRLSARQLGPAEVRRLGLAPGSYVREVLPEGHEIGAHPPAQLIAERWASLAGLE